MLKRIESLSGSKVSENSDGEIRMISLMTSTTRPAPFWRTPLQGQASPSSARDTSPGFGLPSLTEMRDTIGVIAMSLGIDISTLTTFEEAQPAFDKLQEAKDSGQIRRFHGNDYFDDLSNGNLAITIGWSGDVAAIVRATSAGMVPSPKPVINARALAAVPIAAAVSSAE